MECVSMEALRSKKNLQLEKLIHAWKITWTGHQDLYLLFFRNRGVLLLFFSESVATLRHSYGTHENRRARSQCTLTPSATAYVFRFVRTQRGIPLSLTSTSVAGSELVGIRCRNFFYFFHHQCMKDTWLPWNPVICRNVFSTPYRPK